MDNSPSLTLKVPGAEDLALTIGRLGSKKYLQHAVLLPWTTPQRLFGFIHPEQEKLINKEPITLFGALAYYGSVGMQQVGADKMRAVEGPKLLLPYDLIAPVDVVLYSCPAVIWIRDQSEAFQQLFDQVLLQTIDPPRIEAPGSLVHP